MARRRHNTKNEAGHAEHVRAQVPPPEERQRQARRQRVEHVVAEAIAGEVCFHGPARRRRVAAAAAVIGAPRHGLLIVPRSLRQHKTVTLPMNNKKEASAARCGAPSLAYFAALRNRWQSF